MLAALCLILAVAACGGPPPGAKEAVQRLAALDIVTSPPPQGARVAYAEDLGSDSSVTARDPSVIAVYATTATIDDLRDYYVSAFPAYGIAEKSGGDANRTSLEGRDSETYIVINISRDAPHYTGYSTPSPSPAPEGADVYVVVDGFPLRTS